jgi:probable rRNA maturation factor
VRRAALAALAHAQVRPVGRGACEWSVRLSDDAELQRLNQQFRGIDKSTDVLSFGGEHYQDGKPLGGAYSVAANEDAEYLGDIVISVDRCIAQAAAGRHAVDVELALLVVHGTLHLLGYDHDTRARKARMWSAQTRALQYIGIELDVP